MLYKKKLPLTGTYHFCMDYIHFLKKYYYFKSTCLELKTPVFSFNFWGVYMWFGTQTKMYRMLNPFWRRISPNFDKKKFWSQSLSFPTKGDSPPFRNGFLMIPIEGCEKRRRNNSRGTLYCIINRRKTENLTWVERRRCVLAAAPIISCGPCDKQLVRVAEIHFSRQSVLLGTAAYLHQPWPMPTTRLTPPSSASTSPTAAQTSSSLSTTRQPFPTIWLR